MPSKFAMSGPPRGRSSRLLVLSSLLAASALLLTACASAETPSEPQGPSGADANSELIEGLNDAGVTVAVGSSLPNSSINSDGTAAGVEPEVTLGVLNAMGIDNVKVLQVDYATMIPGLQASQFNIVAGALYMNDKRCAAAAISEPIVVGTYSFLYSKALQNPPTTLKELAQAEEIKVALISGSLQLKSAITAGVSESRILQVTGVRDEVEALKQGRVDLVIENTASLKAIVGDDDSLMITPRITDLPRVGSGAIFRPNDAAFRDAFNTALAEFKNDGSFTKIAEKYGVDPQATLDGPTGAELCKNPG